MINKHDDTYLDAMKHILLTGSAASDRTGVGTCRMFGRQDVYDLRRGFPALTTKKLAWLAVKSELLWFIEGSGDERRLAEILHGTRDPANKTIWTSNSTADYWKPKAKFDGDLGNVYGVMWRSWPSATGSIDQLTGLIEQIKSQPQGRRHILSAWNPGELDNMALPPCHCFAQFYVTALGELECLFHQRSADWFLGVPFNIASYGLLTHMIAQVCNLKVGRLIHSVGDAHVYSDHMDQCQLQLSREPFPAPQLWLNENITNIDQFKMDDIKLIGYQSHAAIAAPMAV